MKKGKAIRIVGPDGSMESWFRTMLAKVGIELVGWNARTKQGGTNAEWISSITLQRPQEIPDYIKRGLFDLAVVGEDWLANWEVELDKLLVVPIGRQGGKVKIVLAAPRDSPFKSRDDLCDGIEVATEYAGLARQYFAGLGIEANIIASWGNTESKILYGADVIVDVTETGNSLRQNGLEIIDVMMESGMAIVTRPGLEKDEELAGYAKLFSSLVRGAMIASSYVRIEANVPYRLIERAGAIMGGLKGPTLSPVSKSDWWSLTSYIMKDKELEIIFELAKIGVEDIAVLRDIPLLMGA